MAQDEERVLAANAAFYDAFSRRDYGAMDALWARSVPLVTCIHPGWQPLLGRVDVMRSWRAILLNPDAPRLRSQDARAVVLGDTAFVVCTEILSGSLLCATNLFVREEGQWRLVHHQAGIVQPMGADVEDDDDDAPAPSPPRGLVN